MPRTLTAADREPETGDVLIDTRRAYWERTVEDVDAGYMTFWEGRGWYSMKNAKWWHYISRADGGSVTTEAE